MRKQTSKKFILPINSIIFTFFFAIIFFLYLHNLTHDIFGGDIGDLVSAAYLMGVPHPSGYPLFTFVGFILSHLPFAVSPVTKIAYISLFSSLLSIIFYKKILDLLVKNPLVKFISILILSFSYLFWLYSEIPEVFAMNTMFVLLITYLSIRFHKIGGYYNFLTIVFFLGLSLTHHQTIILITPFVLILFCKRYKLILNFKKKLLLAPIFFILGLTPYLYIFIAASKNPVINWGNASEIGRFIALVTRQDYGTFSAGPFPQPVFEARIIAVKEFFTTLISSVSFPGFVLGIIGMLYFLRKDKILGLALFLSFFLSGPFFAAYANFPIINTFVLGAVERFYLFSQVIFIIFLAVGLEGIFLFSKRVFSKPEYAILIVCVFAIIPILLFKANYEKTDLSTVSIGDNFGYDVLKNVDKNSLLIVSGDTKTFNTWYVYLILKYRSDIDLIQMGNFGIRNDYFDTVYERVVKRYKDLGNIGLFAEAVKEALKEKKVYSSTPVNKIDNSFIWLPRGLVFELIKDEEIPSEDDYKKIVLSDWNKINIPVRKNLTVAERSLTTSDIPAYYADALVTAGLFIFSRYDDSNFSMDLFNKAVKTDPLYSKGYASRSQVYSRNGECIVAEKEIRHAISLLPTESTYYLLWYLYQKDCFKNEKQKKYVADQYRNIFRRNIDEDVKKMVK